MQILAIIISVVALGIFISAVAEVSQKKSFMLGIMAMCLWCISGLIMLVLPSSEPARETVVSFVDDHIDYLPSQKMSIHKFTEAETLPDGCIVYEVIMMDADSMYTYAVTLDPEKTEVLNFILEEVIPRHIFK